MESRNEVTRFRSGMATLLAIQVRDAGLIEEKLGVVVGDDASARAIIEDMPFGPTRLFCALLLHKANIHMVGMLRANDGGNLHSLAVQMRPVLECAGQVKHMVHNLLIEPENALDTIKYIDSDYLGTFVRLTKGEMSHKQLFDQISDMHKTLGETPPSKIRSLRQIEKVAPLDAGEDWYDHLSTYFCHGEGDWRGSPWQGGIVSANKVQVELALAGFMDYLVGQVAIMNSYAALLIPSTRPTGERMDIILNQLKKVRAESETLRDNAFAAVEQMKEQN